MTHYRIGRTAEGGAFQIRLPADTDLAARSFVSLADLIAAVREKIPLVHPCHGSPFLLQLGAPLRALANLEPTTYAFLQLE